MLAPLKPRIIRAARGNTLSARTWMTEAPLRMLMNNLDPEVAENPAELVVYGGIGRAARDWNCYDRIVETLKRLDRGGNPAGAVRQAGGRVPDACGCAAGADRQFQSGAALGDLGALQRARPQGPGHVRPDDRRLLDLHRQPGHRARHLRNLRRNGPAPLRRSGSPASGYSRRASAAWAARSRWRPPWPGFSMLAVECRQSRIAKRLETGYVDAQAQSLDEALAMLEAAKNSSQADFGRAARQHRRCAARPARARRAARRR